MLSIQRARGTGTALANLSHTNGSSNIRVRQVLRKSAGVLPLHARSFSTAQTQSNQGSDAEQSRMSLGFRLKKFFFGEKGTEPQPAQTQTQQTQTTQTKQPPRTIQKQQPTQPKPAQTIQASNVHPATQYKQHLLARQQTHTPRTHTQPQFRQPQKKPRHNYLRHTQNPRIQTPIQQTQTAAQTQAQEQTQTELPPIASEKEINSYLNAREKITRITLHAQTETEKGETDEEIETEKEKTEREKEKERERRGQERDALSALKKRETIASSELKLQPEEVQPPNEVCARVRALRLKCM